MPIASSFEPSWFARFPVGPLVTEYIVRCAREIAGAQVVVADSTTCHCLPGEVSVMHHPSVSHWRGTADTMPRLFPEVPDRS